MRRQTIVMTSSACLIVLGAGMALAQTGGGYDLTWSTVDGGGQMFSTGGGYEMGATIGQADANSFAAPLAGSGYELTGGFWPAAAVACACPGDMNADTKKNAKDIQLFVTCYVWGGGCSCADLDGSSTVTPADVTLFVADLLAGTACP